MSGQPASGGRSTTKHVLEYGIFLDRKQGSKGFGVDIKTATDSQVKRREASET